MDHNTLWFIANGGARQMGPGPAPRPYRPVPTGTPQGPYFKCEKDHLDKRLSSSQRGKAGNIDCTTHW